METSLNNKNLVWSIINPVSKKMLHVLRLFLTQFCYINDMSKCVVNKNTMATLIDRGASGAKGIPTNF